MPTNLTCLRVFIASPSGLSDERRAFRDEIRQYNDTEAVPRGILFRPIGWEDTLGGIGRPQSIINEDVRKSDCFVLLLANRWGSSPNTRPNSRFSSGTEEEYHVALECFKDPSYPMEKLVLMFGAVDPQQLSDPGPQLQKVLEFREQIEREKTHLFHSFDTPERFRALLRKHLAAWLRNQEGGPIRDDRDRILVESLVPADPVSEEIVGTEETKPVEQPKDSVIAKAWSLADEGRLTEAEVEFAKAVVGRRSPEAMVSYGQFLHRVGRLDQAEVVMEKATQVAQEQGDEHTLASAYSNLGNVHRVRGDLDSAEEMHRKALEINEKLGRLGGIASNYINLGVMLRARGDLDGAEEMHRKALEIDEKLGRLGGMASAYGNLGNVFESRGDLDSAEEVYRKALEIDEKLGRLEGMASAYGNLGVMLRARGDLDGAEEMHRKALEIDEKLGRPEGMARQYGNLGNVFKSRGDLDGAEEMHRKALEIDEKLGRLEGMASAYGNLGILLYARGDINRAKEMGRKALESMRAIWPARVDRESDVFAEGLRGFTSEHSTGD